MSSANFCRLFSSDENIPHQNIAINTSIRIGRNRECRITDLKCSRNYYEVFYDGNANTIRVTNCRDGSVNLLTNGQTISGPGFNYKIVIIGGQTTNSTDSTDSTAQQIASNSINSINGSISIDANKSMNSDDQVFAYNDLSEVKEIQKQTYWQTLSLGHVYMCHFLGGGEVSATIAAFDFDGTLVTPKSGNKYPANGDDWKLLSESLPNRIDKLRKDGYRIVVISNQLGVSQGRTKLDDIKRRFEGALTAIGCPCLLLIACYDDKYRKPRPGLWELLANESRDTKIDCANSFYVGDAAGRKKQLNGKSDHSSADILLAANLNLPFLTPELFLRDAKPKIWNSSISSYQGFTITSFRPKQSDKNYIAINIESKKTFNDINEIVNLHSNALHLILFCGLPASGKSTFYTNHLEPLGYEYVSRDQLKTMEKCEKKVSKHLSKRVNCVIDNINVDTPARYKWINLCKQYSALPVLFYFDIPVHQALHNNIFRRIIGVNTPVTDLVIRSQNKNFVKPSIKEGFAAIYSINFVPKFPDSGKQSLYYMYLNEK